MLALVGTAASQMSLMKHIAPLIPVCVYSSFQQLHSCYAYVKTVQNRDFKKVWSILIGDFLPLFSYPNCAKKLVHRLAGYTPHIAVHTDTHFFPLFMSTARLTCWPLFPLKRISPFSRALKSITADDLRSWCMCPLLYCLWSVGRLWLGPATAMIAVYKLSCY